MSVHLSWKEWVDWTEDNKEDITLKELEQDLNAVLGESVKVRQFVALMEKWINYHQIQEYGNYCQNPMKVLRNYSECLRDILNLLERLGTK